MMRQVPVPGDCTDGLESKVRATEEPYLPGYASPSTSFWIAVSSVMPF